MYLVDIFNILADTFWSLTEEFPVFPEISVFYRLVLLNISVLFPSLIIHIIAYPRAREIKDISIIMSVPESRTRLLKSNYSRRTKSRSRRDYFA